MDNSSVKSLIMSKLMGKINSNIKKQDQIKNTKIESHFKAEFNQLQASERAQKFQNDYQSKQNQKNWRNQQNQSDKSQHLQQEQKEIIQNQIIQQPQSSQSQLVVKDDINKQQQVQDHSLEESMSELFYKQSSKINNDQNRMKKIIQMSKQQLDESQEYEPQERQEFESEDFSDSTHSQQHNDQDNIEEQELEQGTSVQLNEQDYNHEIFNEQSKQSKSKQIQMKRAQIIRSIKQKKKVRFLLPDQSNNQSCLYSSVSNGNYSYQDQQVKQQYQYDNKNQIQEQKPQQFQNQDDNNEENNMLEENHLAKLQEPHKRAVVSLEGIIDIISESSSSSNNNGEDANPFDLLMKEHLGKKQQQAIKIRKSQPQVLEEDHFQPQLIRQKAIRYLPLKQGKKFDKPYDFVIKCKKPLKKPEPKYFESYYSRFLQRRQKHLNQPMDLGVAFLDQVLQQCHKHKLITSHEFFNFLANQGMYTYMKFLDRLTKGHLDNFNFHRQAFSLLDHRRLTETLIQLYGDQYYINKEQGQQTFYHLHTEVTILLRDIYALSSSDYDRLMQIVDGISKIIWWDRIRQIRCLKIGVDYVQRSQMQSRQAAAYTQQPSFHPPYESEGNLISSEKHLLQMEIAHNTIRQLLPNVKMSISQEEADKIMAVKWKKPKLNKVIQSRKRPEVDHMASSFQMESGMQIFDSISNDIESSLGLSQHLGLKNSRNRRKAQQNRKQTLNQQSEDDKEQNLIIEPAIHDRKKQQVKSSDIINSPGQIYYSSNEQNNSPIPDVDKIHKINKINAVIQKNQIPKVDKIQTIINFVQPMRTRSQTVMKTRQLQEPKDKKRDKNSKKKSKKSHEHSKNQSYKIVIDEEDDDEVDIQPSKKHKKDFTESHKHHLNDHKQHRHHKQHKQHKQKKDHKQYKQHNKNHKQRHKQHHKQRKQQQHHKQENKKSSIDPNKIQKDKKMAIPKIDSLNILEHKNQQIHNKEKHKKMLNKQKNQEQLKKTRSKHSERQKVQQNRTKNYKIVE